MALLPTLVAGEAEMMFCTHPDGEMPIPAVFNDRSENWWSYVKLPLFVPYFQLVCGTLAAESDGSAQTFFFPTIDQVLMVLSDPGTNVSSVQIVSPGYMNGTGIWQIDVLKAVYRGVESRSEDLKQYAHVYVVADGLRYLQSSIAVAECDLTNVELICDLSAI